MHSQRGTCFSVSVNGRIRRSRFPGQASLLGFSRIALVRTGLTIPQVQGRSSPVTPSATVILPSFTSSNVSRTRLKDTIPWPHIVVTSRISRGIGVDQSDFHPTPGQGMDHAQRVVTIAQHDGETGLRRETDLSLTQFNTLLKRPCLLGRPIRNNDPFLCYAVPLGPRDLRRKDGTRTAGLQTAGKLFARL